MISNKAERGITSSVSIVTTVFQDLERLIKTGSSVLLQDYPIEWVVIDADSGVDTRQYLQSIDTGHHSLVWISEKDRGLYDGMNKGFQLSKGELVLFLNAGDLLLEADTISKVVDSYQSQNWKWAVALAVRVTEDGTPRAVWEYLNPQLSGLALGTRTFCHQSTFYARQLLGELPPYDINNLAADHLLNIRAFKRQNPTMLTFVTTLFEDGGISSQRPFSASMKDLRRIRIEENLLIANSKVLDAIASSLIVWIVNLSGKLYALLRIFSRKFISELPRMTPNKIIKK
jgi:glycosyltransferase involved in cell wall biosynthesis